MLTKALQANRSKLFSQRFFAAKVVQDPLPWEISSLEPVLSGKLLDHHYNNHHKTYVVKFNETLDQMEEAKTKGDFQKIAALGHNMRFFGGGNYNHKFFWESLSPVSCGGGQTLGPDSELTKMINA